MTDAGAFVERLEPLLLPYLERQSWYWAALTDSAGGAPRSETLRVERAEILREGPPAEPERAGLARLVLANGSQRLQLVIGWREPSAAAVVLRGRDLAILGAMGVGESDEVLVYDALADEELILAILEVASGGRQAAKRARLVESLTSHASIVYDDGLFMKLYRVLQPAPRPEVEVMLRLDEIGFNYIVAPVALWRADGSDLALLREFYAGALEGRSLALTSLRDLLGSLPEGTQPFDAGAAAAAAGGDLAAEVRRLGETTARLHVALAEAFGVQAPDLAGLADEVEEAGEPETAGRIRTMTDGGRWIRVHGDYHLRRVMRTDVGWLVVGFGDDPSRAAPTGVATGASYLGTPLEDVADLRFSVEEVTRAACEEQAPESASARQLGAAWVQRNSTSFLEGYRSVPGIAPLIPRHPAAVDVLLSGLAAVRARRAEAAERLAAGAGWRRRA